MSLSADAVYRILIVDDSTEDREIFKRYLTQRRQLTYAFSEAETIEAGLKCFAESPPACVLLDYLLPDGNGLEFLERVASEFPPHEIRVVMLTGYGDEAVIVTAMKMGAMDYLSKGQLNADALNRVVYSAIEKGSTLAALAVANARATKDAGGAGTFQRGPGAVRLRRLPRSTRTIEHGVPPIYSYSSGVTRVSSIPKPTSSSRYP